MLIKNTLMKEFKYNDDKNISIETILQFISRHETERLPLILENKNFLSQNNLEIETEFLNQESKGRFPAVRHKNNLANVITKTHQSYVMGSDLQYTSEVDQEESLKLYLDIRKKNKGNEKEKKVSQLMGEYGNAFEIIYMDSNQNIKFSTASPEQCFLLYNYDLEPEAIWGIRYFRDFNNSLNIELYGKYVFRRYVVEDSNAPTMLEEKINYFGKVCMLEAMNNDFRFSDFQPVKTFLVDIDKTLTTQGYLIHYIIDAILIITNATIDEDDFQDMLDGGVVLLENGGDGADSKMDFLEKPLNVEGIKQHLEFLFKNVFNQSFTPFISGEELKTAPSAKALEVMYLAADLVAKIKEANLSKIFEQRIDLIFRMINFTRNTPLEYDSIKPVFTKSLPTLTTAELEELQKLISTGVVLSNRTLLELIPNKFVNDVEKELKRIEEEGTQGFIDFSQEEEEVIPDGN